MAVELLVGAGPRSIVTRTLSLPENTTVAEALNMALMVASRDAELSQALAAIPQPWVVGIWNKLATLSQTLQTGDRLELYRPLSVDPKAARRERFKKQGAKTAGLFAKLRAGAKAGY